MQQVQPVALTQVGMPCFARSQRAALHTHELLTEPATAGKRRRTRSQLRRFAFEHVANQAHHALIAPFRFPHCNVIQAARLKRLADQGRDCHHRKQGGKQRQGERQARQPALQYHDERLCKTRIGPAQHWRRRGASLLPARACGFIFMHPWTRMRSRQTGYLQCVDGAMAAYLRYSLQVRDWRGRRRAGSPASATGTVAR